MQASECSGKTVTCLKTIKLPNLTNYTISIPIPIPRTNSNCDELDLTDQYSLNANIFNPSKMSPPDNWRCRLEKRIKDFNYESNILPNE